MTVGRSTLHNLVSHPAFQGEGGKAERTYIILVDSVLQELFELKFDQNQHFDDKERNLLAVLRTLVVAEDPIPLVLSKYKGQRQDPSTS